MSAVLSLGWIELFWFFLKVATAGFAVLAALVIIAAVIEKIADLLLDLLP